MWAANEEITNEVPDPYDETVIGSRHYELTNHLGNVLTVVTDMKFFNGEYWEADVINVRDYYPFGMLMPERSYTVDANYRYGFNGKENDNDVKGVEGSQQDYGMRIYDPRLGRFLSVDPLTKEYPWYTPYQFAGNKPINSIDLDGAEELKVFDKRENFVTLNINKVIVVHPSLPSEIRRISNERLASIFNQGNKFLLLDRVPENYIKVHQLPFYNLEEKGVLVKIQFNISVEKPNATDYNTLFGLYQFNNLYSFMKDDPTLIFSENAPFRATSEGPARIFPNLDFFNNSPVIGINIEALIAHEVGFHNMMGKKHSRNPRTNQAIYPQIPTLESDDPRFITPTPSNIIDIINNAAEHNQIKKDELFESLMSKRGLRVDNSILRPQKRDN